MNIESKPIILEEVATFVQSSPDGLADLWLIDRLSKHPAFEHLDLPRRIYVVDFPQDIGHRLLIQRQLAGMPKFLLVNTVTVAMVRFFAQEFIGKVGIFHAMWGGQSQFILTADPPIFTNLPDSVYIKLQREFETTPDGTKRLARVVVKGQCGKWWEVDTAIFMEECMASGSSAGKLGKCFFTGLTDKGRHQPEKIFVFPVYASAEGFGPLLNLCRERGVEFIPVVNSAILQLQQKGVTLPLTDLTWGSRTIASKEFHAVLAQRTQGKAFCLAGDVGRAFHDKFTHWAETLHDMQALGMAPQDELWNRWQPEFRGPEFGNWLARNHTSLFEYLRPVHDRIWNGSSKKRPMSAEGQDTDSDT